ncbi:MAG: flagellar protein FlaG [Aquificota bacterium]|nr:flagellar protein FlaG [Aquificota bacterium]
MRVEVKGSEVDLNLIRHMTLRPEGGAENLRKELEARSRELESRVNMSEEEIQRIIQEIKRKLDYMNRYLRIDIDQQLEIPVVKIFERDTNRLIRQIPPEYLLELMKRIDQMLGVLLNERV